MTPLMILFLLGVATGVFTTWSLVFLTAATKPATRDRNQWTVASIAARIQAEGISPAITFTTAANGRLHKRSAPDCS
ncbi:hypothetical protein [Nocardia inohanensis]|uniref:hypothetical protein n=1 Tax=Nocardia inohanensis TaxID=209246 RepID=UPI0008326259|nr:hypothetical protein [Nocardia inohanensis]